jgi:phosphatidate cytidylyltransferase
MNNLSQRVIVAAVAIPAILYIVLYKPVAFFILVLILAGFAAHEFYGLAKAKGYLSQSTVGVILSVLIAMTFGRFRLQAILSAIGVGFISPETDLLSMILTAGVIVTMSIELFRGFTNPLEHISTTLAGAVYTGIGLGSAFGIYEYFTVKNLTLDRFDFVPPGVFIVVLLASIWVCDSAAYFAGKAFGKHKLFERVSPNKTWEGSVAGLLAAVATWIVAGKLWYEFSNFPLLHCVILGIIAGTTGQIGDLVESLLKRDAGVKDSSQLIPGHGGILDRLDSILFVAPITLLYLLLARV